MPKAAYSKEHREHIRNELVAVGLELMAKQGIQHTTVGTNIQKSWYITYFLLFLFPDERRSYR